MNKWLEKSALSVSKRKKEGFYDDWIQKKFKYITFRHQDNFQLPKNWIKKRLITYRKNASILGIKKVPKVNFYVYESVVQGMKYNILPTIAIVGKKEVHGHLNQSPGHELTHILIGSLSPIKKLPANGLWHEGLSTYLNGTKTNQKRHLLSLKLSDNILKIPWSKYRNSSPNNLYPLFGSVIQYIVKIYGWKRLIEFIKRIDFDKKNEDIQSQKIFGIKVSLVQSNWLKWIKKGGDT